MSCYICRSPYFTGDSIEECGPSCEHYTCPNCDKDTCNCNCIISPARRIILSNNDVDLKVKLIHPDSKAPIKAHDDDACFDIFAYTPNGIIFYSEQIWLIPTGLKMSVPSGWEIQVRSRSGLALKGLHVMNSPGTIDSGYRGEVGVIFHNSSREKHIVNHGDKIAQIKVSRVPTVKISIVDELDESERGTNGYGSSGNV